MANDGLRIIDGTVDFSGGVQSATVKTKRTEAHPSGIAENQIAWAINSTMRGGGVFPRFGWEPRVQNAPWSGIYQGGFMYQPDFGDPIQLVLIGGRLYRIRVDTDFSVTDLSALYGLTMPADAPQAYFEQAEMFCVIQAGDLITNPLFYDFGVEGVRPETLRRSNGFVGVNDPTNEIPPAGPMSYYQNRLWYAIGGQYIAGDIVRNLSSGTAPYDYRDSVLHVTENPVATRGDGFIVPTSAGNIRALKWAANLDTALGQTNLYVFTRNTVFACNAPITRADWIAATNDNQPLQTVALAGGGCYAERSVVAVNGDLYWLAPPNGDVRSLQASLRYFHQPGQVPISRNVDRAIQFNNRELMRFGTGILFDNRLLESCLPVTTPVGVAWRSLLPLDFDLISTLEQRLPPAWEGVLEGVYILQLFQGEFGGVQKAFAMVWSQLEGNIQLWQFTTTSRTDTSVFGSPARIQWSIETPAYSFRNPYQLKQLETMELWLDRLAGTVDFTVEYRPDQAPCWIPWATWQECAAADCSQEFDSPCASSGYPLAPFCDSFRATRTLPKPVAQCISAVGRPSDVGYMFQVRLTVHGWCRVRGLLLHAIPLTKRPFEAMIECGVSPGVKAS